MWGTVGDEEEENNEAVSGQALEAEQNQVKKHGHDIISGHVMGKPVMRLQNPSAKSWTITVDPNAKPIERPRTNVGEESEGGKGKGVSPKGKGRERGRRRDGAEEEEEEEEDDDDEEEEEEDDDDDDVDVGSKKKRKRGKGAAPTGGLTTTLILPEGETTLTTAIQEEEIDGYMLNPHEKTKRLGSCGGVWFFGLACLHHATHARLTQ